jgi:hypothetical protein
MHFCALLDEEHVLHNCAGICVVYSNYITPIVDNDVPVRKRNVLVFPLSCRLMGSQHRRIQVDGVVISHVTANEVVNGIIRNEIRVEMEIVTATDRCIYGQTGAIECERFVRSHVYGLEPLKGNCIEIERSTPAPCVKNFE